MYIARGVIAIFILSLSSYAYGIDYTITVPDTEKTRVETAIQKAYNTTVPQAIAKFLFQTVKNVEVNEAIRTAETNAKTTKEADIDSKLVITSK